jgi:hypothetical protein
MSDLSPDSPQHLELALLAIEHESEGHSLLAHAAATLREVWVLSGASPRDIFSIPTQQLTTDVVNTVHCPVVTATVLLRKLEKIFQPLASTGTPSHHLNSRWQPASSASISSPPPDPGPSPDVTDSGTQPSAHQSTAADFGDTARVLDLTGGGDGTNANGSSTSRAHRHRPLLERAIDAVNAEFGRPGIPVVKFDEKEPKEYYTCLVCKHFRPRQKAKWRLKFASGGLKKHWDRGKTSGDHPHSDTNLQRYFGNRSCWRMRASDGPHHDEDTATMPPPPRRAPSHGIQVIFR